jgi:hypothetical protein
MDDSQALEWAKTFENRSISELTAMMPPEALGHSARQRWSRAHALALKGARARDAETAAAEHAVHQTPEPPLAACADAPDVREDDMPIAAESPVMTDAITEPAQALPSAGDEICEKCGERMDLHIDEGATENLRGRIAAAIARNNAPEPVLRPLRAPVVLERKAPLEAMEIQISSSASMVEGMAQQFREQDFSAPMTCEIMKSMAVLIAANAALGRVVYHFHDDAADAAGRRSNAF